MGRWIGRAAARNKGGCYCMPEGGYNHSVPGENAQTFLEGLTL